MPSSSLMADVIFNFQLFGYWNSILYLESPLYVCNPTVRRSSPFSPGRRRTHDTYACKAIKCRLYYCSEKRVTIYIKSHSRLFHQKLHTQIFTAVLNIRRCANCHSNIHIGSRPIFSISPVFVVFPYWTGYRKIYG